ncbi:MAG: pilin, partial [Patescibacteria group bacterium]
MVVFKKIFFISLALVIVFLPVFVFGVEGEEVKGGLVPCGTQVNEKGEVTNPCTLCDIFVLIKKIMDFAALIAIPLAVGFMAYGGIRMAAAGGSTESLEKGRKALTSALIGIFLVFGAWLIIDLIMGNLLKKGGVFWPWNEFPKCEQARGQADAVASLPSGIISGASLIFDKNL